MADPGFSRGVADRQSNSNDRSSEARSAKRLAAVDLYAQGATMCRWHLKSRSKQGTERSRQGLRCSILDIVLMCARARVTRDSRR